jgi:hypothetical protein
MGSNGVVGSQSLPTRLAQVKRHQLAGPRGLRRCHHIDQSIMFVRRYLHLELWQKCCNGKGAQLKSYLSSNNSGTVASARLVPDAERHRDATTSLACMGAPHGLGVLLSFWLHNATRSAAARKFDV